ncbi:hypothetical protein PAECIP111893_00007 [Paenibacillus plantiphilus]|uniref:DNA and RNA helicase n=1 Tax=Paenibacillus plantiphilus TaxID=2905650 RepID=A0ABM9BL05_9BACL|nr:DNA and RNA helicase [Paenibacillus plantiphilus]CAH1189909.1 hypothetical protein PAECIP111893_00007 [Paenibacillus plantiphilus]
MFADRYPMFQKGRILKTEMLESLRDYPRHVIDLYWSGYSDGILAGAEVRTSDEGSLTITQGIVKHGGHLYVLAADCKLPYKATGRDLVVKLQFQESATRGDMVCYESEIVLDDHVELRPNELELGRFKLKEGARLRSDYQSFADMATEYNTINLLHTEYAGRGRSTLAPAVIHYYAAELLKTGSSDIYDIAFAMQCMNSGTVERQVIEHYIAHRLRIERKDYSNVQLHRFLVRVLDESGSGGGRSGGMRSDYRHGGPQRVLVD